MTEMTDWATFWRDHPTPWSARYLPESTTDICIQDTTGRAIIIHAEFASPSLAEKHLAELRIVCQLANQHAAAERLADVSQRLRDETDPAMRKHWSGPRIRNASELVGAALADYRKAVEKEQL